MQDINQEASIPDLNPGENGTQGTRDREDDDDPRETNDDLDLQLTFNPIYGSLNH